MLIQQLIESGFPHLTIGDKVKFALYQMDDLNIRHLPIIADSKYAGLISREDLENEDEGTEISILDHHFLVVSLFPDMHFLEALKTVRHFEVSLLPVINKAGELLGVVTAEKLLYTAAVFNNTDEPGGLIVFQTDKRNFSVGEISRLIETNDASITQLNTYTEADTGFLIVTIRINTIEISDIIATLQRYDYHIRYYFGEESYENELKENYDMLMNYLSI